MSPSDLSLAITNRLPSIRRWVILAMLLSLHAGLLADHESYFQRIWLMIHFGLFLLWQPFVNTESELKGVSAVVLGTVTVCVLYFLSGWMLVTWLSILIAIMGGKVFMQPAIKRSRFYLVAAFYLLTVLLAWVVPVSLLTLDTFPAGTKTLVQAFLPVVLLTLAFLPYRSEDEGTTQLFDFFYSLVVLQLVAVLVMGSIALMRVTGNQYFNAVVLVVLIFSVALFVLAVLWAPRGGFGGLGTYFSRYLMSVGMPFEQWMRRIAQLSETDMTPARFLELAMRENETVPWIVGGEWQSPDGNGSFGQTRGYPARFKYHELDIAFFTEISLSPALLLHLRLLAQVVGEFYEGKRREQVLKQNAYMSAVHETGAKLTHDIKNLLQSLLALTSIGANRREDPFRGDDRRSSGAYQSMMDRQLPQLTKRLQTTLDKLQNPAINVQGVELKAGEWWEELALRHADMGITFSAEGNMDCVIPTTLFESVLENCLENVRKKHQREPDIAITVTLLISANKPSLTIADNGNAIPAAIADVLFRAPMSATRGGGLGIGLFQVQRQAEKAGYALSLSSNIAGSVVFLLSPQNLQDEK